MLFRKNITFAIISTFPVTMETTSLRTAQNLLHIKAVRLSPEKPYRWASGWLSPIYCDNRKILAYPAIRQETVDSLVTLIKTHYNLKEIDTIAGVATGAIAMGVLVAAALDKPFIYVRPEPKSHGMGNQIEGELPSQKKVLVVEDLISTGGSSLKVVNVLRNHSAYVMGMVAIFTYEFPSAIANFLTAECTLHTLSTYSALLQQAVSEQYIAPEMLPVLEAWRTNPSQYSFSK